MLLKAFIPHFIKANLLMQKLYFTTNKKIAKQKIFPHYISTLQIL